MVKFLALDDKRLPMRWATSSGRSLGSDGRSYECCHLGCSGRVQAYRREPSSSRSRKHSFDKLRSVIGFCKELSTLGNGGS